MNAFVLRREYELQLPNNFVDVDIEEMEYVDGGSTAMSTGSAKNLKVLAGTLMASWFSLAGGYTYAAAVSVASALGIGAGVIAGIGASYCAFAGNEYRQAYNYFSSKNQIVTKRYQMTTTFFLGVVTGVSYGVA
ncbi:hypothetical protein [Clostridium sp. YIM B02506]|uniref:hypothetical protein n=1 Tax=Clostridium sp. YIM B02506 TaxID=2910680 RepID=UPI001EEF33C0|nr:hypothetical protein [Clostridium sp. YIM B02506]